MSVQTMEDPCLEDLDERRASQRLHVKDMFVGVKKHVGVEVTACVPVMHIDISKGGLCILSLLDFEIGEKIYVDLVFKDRLLTDIPARTVGRKSVASVKRYNLEFVSSEMTDSRQHEISSFLDAISS